MSKSNAGRNHSESPIRIAPSILAADWLDFGEAVDSAVFGGADAIHLDIMDGHFVPELTFGRQLVTAVRSRTSLPLDAHLMVLNPERHVEPMIEAGVDQLTVHLEAAPEPDALRRLLSDIRGHGVRAGVALRPLTPVQVLTDIWDFLDMVLVMTVEPGYGGKSFQEELLPKVHDLAGQPNPPLIAVDGGIDHRTAPLVTAAGATFLVAGSSIYGTLDPAAEIAILRNNAERGRQNRKRPLGAQ